MLFKMLSMGNTCSCVLFDFGIMSVVYSQAKTKVFQELMEVWALSFMYLVGATKRLSKKKVVLIDIK